MNTCPNCHAINSIAPIKTPDGDQFILVAKKSDGSFSLPPNGIIVNALGCNKCGVVTLGTPELIGKTIER